jgi:uncharacterized RDD family membrane protein YckC
MIKNSNFIRIGAQHFERAPLWKRYAAGLIDAIILFVLLFIPFFNFFFVPFYLLGRDSLPFLKGGSFGKKILGLMVISKAHGAHLAGDHSSSIGRSAFLLLGIDVIVPLFRKDKMRFGDIYAYTEVVVKKEIKIETSNKDRYVDIVNRYYPIYLEKENFNTFLL